jgi:AcrR family transcriptional regulator
MKNLSGVLPPGRKPGKPQYSQARRNRERIVSAAARLFGRKGYKGTSLNDIAKAAKVNKATIYYHFTKKTAILYEIAVNPVYELIELGKPVLASELSSDEKLQLLIRNHIEWLISNPGRVGVYQHLRLNLTPRLFSDYVSIRDEYLVMFQKTIEEGMAEGEFRCAAPYYDSLFIVIFLNAIIQRVNPSREFSIEEIISSAHKLISQALKMG